MNILEVKNLRKWFVKRGLLKRFKSIVRAVDDVSFSIGESSTFVLAGESGSGKSTIARLILRAIEPDEGEIIFDNKDVLKLTSDELKWLRRSAQIVYQDPYASLDPRMKVIDIIREPLTVHDKSSKKEQEEQVLRALRDVRLEPAEEIAYRYPHMLSGGQRQRVAIARALILKPKFIIADEPVSMLDISIRAEILDLMKGLQKEYNISYLYITHDLSTARYIGDKIAVLYKGKIVEYGNIDRVLLNPLHPYTKALINAIPTLDPDNLYKEKVINIKEISSIDNNLNNGCRFYNRCIYAMPKCSSKPELIEVEKDHIVACFIY